MNLSIHPKELVKVSASRTIQYILCLITTSAEFHLLFLSIQTLKEMEFICESITPEVLIWNETLTGSTLARYVMLHVPAISFIFFLISGEDENSPEPFWYLFVMFTMDADRHLPLPPIEFLFRWCRANTFLFQVFD